MKAALLAIGVALLPNPAAAQAAEDRATLERFRAALATVADSAALKQREAEGIAHAKQDRDNALLHLQLGFIAYRLGGLTGAKQHFDDAGSEFQWAGDLQPEWPYPWYGLGLAELAIGEAGSIAFENLRQAFGRDYLTKAADAFARAAAADPAFSAALVDLGETALRQRINARLDVALSTLRAASRAATLGPDVLLLRGRLEREAGAGDSALVAFRQYVAAGGDSGVGLFETARVLYDLGQPARAHTAYLLGSRRARSAAARALYRQDVAWVATAAELQELDGLPPDGDVARWLDRFWQTRDAEAAIRPGDGLAEHERRFLYAWRHFRLVSRHRHYDVTETFRSDQDTFDDRGIVYIRQGEPARRAVYSAPGIEPNESWRYIRPEGNVVLHFVARNDVDDYKLVRSLADVLGMREALRIQTTPGASASAAALFASREELDDLYRRLGAGGEGAASGLLADERQRGTAAVRLGTTTSDYAPRFAHRLEPRVEAYALGDTAAAGRVLLVFALPAADLATQAVPQGQAYPVAVRVTGLGDRGQTLYDDTTRVFVAPHAISGAEHLAWARDVPAPAGVYRLRVLVTQPGTEAGALLRLDSVVVPPFGGGAFAMSDLVAGRHGSGLVWLDGQDTVALNPLGTYPTGGAVDLFYELFGLTPGEHYHARIDVQREGGRSIFQAIAGLFGGGGPALSVEYDLLALGASHREHQRVSLARVEAGRYRLTLTVGGPGREAGHTRSVVLLVQGQ
jgi:GWxTD domain-containing protein